MYLANFKLSNFKTYTDLDVDFCSNINCLVGNNGVGKTNLLDGIYYLSFCKSSSTPMDSLVMRHDTDFAVVQGYYDDEQGGEEEIFCGMKRGQRKVVKRNGKSYSRYSEHVGLLPLVMVSPSDSFLISGGSEERRHFMDAAIAQILVCNSAMQPKDYRSLVNDYEHTDVGLGKEDPDDLGTMRAKRSQAVVTPTGEVLELPGERSAYDLMREELKRLRSQRAPLTPAAVRKLAKIRPAAEIDGSVIDRATYEDGTRSELLKRDDGTLIPLLSCGTGEQVLVVAGDAKDEKAALLKRFAREEAQVTVADLRGFGATSGAVHAFYGLAEDEELGVLSFMLGQPLLGARAEDLIAVARRLGGKVRIIAIGRAAIPAAHARAADPARIGSVSLRGAPKSWHDMVEIVDGAPPMGDVVPNALKAYDWPELLR